MMPESSEALGNVIRRNRKQMGLSQDKVAESIGCSKHTILKIENYKKYAVNPKMETVYLLVRFLNVDVREIFYPEVRQESPSKNALRLLVEQCSEKEAACLLEILRPALDVIRRMDKSSL